MPRHLFRPHDQKVKLPYGWKPLMVSTHPAKCGDYRYSGNGDMMFLVVFRLYMSLLNSVITVYLERTWPTMLTHNISERRHNNSPVCLMKDFWYWSHMFTTKTNGNYMSKFSCPSTNRDGKEKEKKKTPNKQAAGMAIAKLFVLHSNAVSAI